MTAVIYLLMKFGMVFFFDELWYERTKNKIGAKILFEKCPLCFFNFGKLHGVLQAKFWYQFYFLPYLIIIHQKTSKFDQPIYFRSQILIQMAPMKSADCRTLCYQQSLGFTESINLKKKTNWKGRFLVIVELHGSSF